METETMMNELKILESSRLISRKKVAALIGFSERTLDRKSREGTFPSHYVIGRSVNYRFTEVIEWIEQHRAID